ncbi:hypothetical protein CLCR_05283 [Cladophialophora carrionii]|uniref:Cytochrome P450 n=1 Tax=Cladophialophora carrionii TaxID=86049 RepID=A0A1C1CJR9_9EURO|nr:hypothetical protein CLCR_05283 [Cladophialophora carrionii]
MDDASKATQILSEEVLGNLFVFTSAGFDTRRIPWHTLLALLATCPEWQDRLYGEISQIVGHRKMESLEYEELYPHLPRRRALTVRLTRTRHLRSIPSEVVAALR